MNTQRPLGRLAAPPRFAKAALAPAALALALSFACSSSPEDDKGSGGSGASPAAGMSGKAGASAGGSAGRSSGGSAGVMSLGGAPQGGTAGRGGAGGSSGTSGGTGGASGASMTGGTGGTAGTSGGAGGSAGSLGGAGQAGEGGSGEPAVHYVGRVDTSDASAARFAWSGSGVTARFDGTSVAVELDGGQEYTVVLDGEVRPKLVAMTGMNAIATGLAAGEHVIELYRRTEAQQGESVFLGFDFGGGTLLPPPLPTRRLEFIGDSITCGYGIEGPDMNCGFTPQTENHYITYAALTARALNAELSTVAWSGKGVVCNYGDDTSSCTNPLPTYYDRTLPNRDDSAWDFSRFQPDAVVVNLGTNDFSTTDDPTSEQFQTAYVMLLEHLREKYPNASILCTNGPMLSGTDLTTVRSYISAAVATLADPKIEVLEIPAQDGTDGYGCDWHPSAARHEKMAELVTGALESMLGW
jgi:lysophospholipase L1-like esterase